MKLVTITAPLVGGILGVLLMRQLAAPDRLTWLADSLSTSPLLTQAGAFVLGGAVFALARAKVKKAP